MRTRGIIRAGLTLALGLTALAFVPSAGADPPANANAYGITKHLTDSAGDQLTLTVKRNNAVAPVGAPIPGTDLVVGPSNSVVTHAQLAAIRHGKRVIDLDADSLFSVTVYGSESGAYDIWYQVVGPVQYWVYGTTEWHGWVDGHYWADDNLDNCANNGGFTWSVDVNYCNWQGNNPVDDSNQPGFDIAVDFHTIFDISLGAISIFHWIYIGCGTLGWSVEYG